MRTLSSTALIALLLAGCGGGGGTDTAVSASPAEPVAAAPAAPKPLAPVVDTPVGVPVNPPAAQPPANNPPVAQPPAVIQPPEDPQEAPMIAGEDLRRALINGVPLSAAFPSPGPGSQLASCGGTMITRGA